MAKPAVIKQQPFKHRIAVICGGSKGIGKETAKEIARLGGSVCLIARGEQELKSTAEEIQALCTSPDQFVEWFASDATDYTALEPLLNEFVNQRGTPDYLINMVGYAYPEYLQNLTFDDFKKNMDVNFLGQVAPMLIYAAAFHQSKERPHSICFINAWLLRDDGLCNLFTNQVCTCRFGRIGSA